MGKIVSIGNAEAARERARHALQVAREAPDPYKRAQWAEIAQAWIVIGEEMERRENRRRQSPPEG